MNSGSKLSVLLGLRWPAVALAFLDAPPAGIPRIAAAGLAGCSYWRLAAEGQAFYTEASDHHGCTIGSFTHGVDMPPEKAQELQTMVQTMVSLQYLQMEEVPSIPRRTAPFGVAVYAPLAQAAFEPDVVLIRGNARQIMLVSEAARAIGIGHDGATMGRPACAMVPQAIESGRAATSLACIGNRVYTGLADEELYFAVPGPKLRALAEKLEAIVHANQELEKFHRSRAASA
jgi:uncharacterized protein (DUF169 family)